MKMPLPCVDYMLNGAVEAAQRNVLPSSKLVGSLIEKLRKEGATNAVRKAILAVILAAGMSAGFVVAGQVGNTKHEPMTFALDCAGGDCPLLKGAPETSGMRGGSVRLKPGESVGWHSTSGNEEALVILHGQGTAHIEDHADVP